jgi:hypothetical protein
MSAADNKSVPLTLNVVYYWRPVTPSLDLSINLYTGHQFNTLLCSDKSRWKLVARFSILSAADNKSELLTLNAACYWKHVTHSLDVLICWTELFLKVKMLLKWMKDIYKQYREYTAKRLWQKEFNWFKFECRPRPHSPANGDRPYIARKHKINRKTLKWIKWAFANEKRETHRKIRDRITAKYAGNGRFLPR